MSWSFPVGCRGACEMFERALTVSYNNNNNNNILRLYYIVVIITCAQCESIPPTSHLLRNIFSAKIRKAFASPPSFLLSAYTIRSLPFFVAHVYILCIPLRSFKSARPPRRSDTHTWVCDIYYYNSISYKIEIIEIPDDDIFGGEVCLSPGHYIMSYKCYHRFELGLISRASRCVLWDILRLYTLKLLVYLITYVDISR